MQTETDFVVAKGVREAVRKPYFHSQEYKRSRKSPPEPLSQLLIAFLIAQETNENDKPLYGATVAGRTWQFVVMQSKQYAASGIYNVTQKEDLQQIVAILRKFKVILETELLD